MAQKAEEYGSHPTTFEIPADGTVRLVLANGEVLHQHEVEAGDIWRAASTRKPAIEDWVRLAIDPPEGRRLPGHLLARRHAPA